MSVKANWHLGELGLPQGDAAAEIMQLKSSATVIDLNGSSADLSAALRASMRREGHFETMFGIVCDLKWGGPDGSLHGGRNPCRSCPEFTADPMEERGLICALGLQQEGLLDAMDRSRALETVGPDFLDRFERDCDAAQELAEALL